jgi:hypothetical protein
LEVTGKCAKYRISTITGPSCDGTVSLSTVLTVSSENGTATDRWLYCRTLYVFAGRKITVLNETREIHKTIFTVLTGKEKTHNILLGKLLQTGTDGYLKKVFSETSVPDPETDPR